MSNRPAEIWCDTGLYWDYKDDWSEGSWTARRTMTGEKYVRADRIEELEAENRRLEGEIESMRAERLERDRTTLAELKRQTDE